jgi:hypothetical protein
MYPYIAGLILLIVVILYQVYASEESFTASSYRELYNQRYPNMVKDASGNPVIAKDASGNPVVVKDGSGNEIKLSLTDLFGLLGPFSMTKKKEEEKVKPADAEVEATPKSIEEVEQRIAKSIAKQVKDELASQRSTDELYDKYAPCDLTDAEAQGQEFEKVRPSPAPDMSEYIRKDSIPCWNCSIP